MKVARPSSALGQIRQRGAQLVLPLRSPDPGLLWIHLAAKHTLEEEPSSLDRFVGESVYQLVQVGSRHGTQILRHAFRISRLHEPKVRARAENPIGHTLSRFDLLAGLDRLIEKGKNRGAVRRKRRADRMSKATPGQPGSLAPPIDVSHFVDIGRNRPGLLQARSELVRQLSTVHCSTSITVIVGLLKKL